jgi:ABC-type multidrug transport system fused ATPase/permease subunit
MKIQTIIKLYSHLSVRRKKQLVGLMILMVITSMAEVVSIGSVLPFVGALMSPENVLSSEYFQPLQNIFQFESHEQLLLPMTISFILLAMLSGGLRMLLLWCQTRFGNGIGADLSAEIFKKTLYQSYSVHVSQNSSKLIVGILSQVGAAVNSGVMPLILAISSLMILSAVFITLVIVSFEVALVIFGSVSLTYGLVMLFWRKRLFKNSQTINKNLNEVTKILQEALGGIRDVLIDGTQNVFHKQYCSADIKLRKAKTSNQILAILPRYVIEVIGISVFASLSYIMITNGKNSEDAIPILAAFAIAAQKILPLAQQVYNSWTAFSGEQNSIDDVITMLDQSISKINLQNQMEKLEFEENISIRNLSYRFPQESKYALKNINLDIPKGSRVGIVGKTGSGKSTLLDILMALLQPHTGGLYVDGALITFEKTRSWQCQLAHVPQVIFLSDCSVLENIAFGVPISKIDISRVKRAAEQAQISSTIEAWDKQYYTIVGERGVRLSGGQRQRIAIARAIYKNASVIIFDEATSALDNETESALIHSINSISREFTLIMVAHRLSTLEKCDVVYELEDGGVKRIL